MKRYYNYTNGVLFSTVHKERKDGTLVKIRPIRFRFMRKLILLKAAILKVFDPNTTYIIAN
jgi:hypothetical protein